MFDPTAYENIKVVFEGLIYDQDLEGNIIIIERNDIVNLADLSRAYNITFIHKRDRKQLLKVKLELNSNFKQIASEWMPMTTVPGVSVSIQFMIENNMDEILKKRIAKLFKQFPGQEYHVDRFKQVYMDERTIFHYIVTKYEPLTEDTIEKIDPLIEQTISVTDLLFQMIQR